MLQLRGAVIHRPCGCRGGSGALNVIQGKGWREKINVVLKSHFLAQAGGWAERHGDSNEDKNHL